MLTIITPTYNEAKNIEELIKKINNSLKGIDYEIIVSDDSSPDGTAEIAMKLSDKFPIKVIKRTKNKGLTPAVCEGFKRGNGEFIAVIDADMSHPPELLVKMLESIKENDIVIASRLIKGGGTENWPNSRKLTSYIATSISKPLTKVKDPMSGYFMLRKEVIEDIKIETKGYKILLEILVKGKYKKVKEIPFIFKDRSAGESKLNIWTNLEYLKQILNLYFYKIK